MCCLYGLMDTKQILTGAQKAKIMHALATVAEARGTDATGYACHVNGKLMIRKQPVPGSRFLFRAQDDTVAFMGHNRFTTQGDEKRNCNNHPFRGHIGNSDFALAHNGVLWNDKHLRERLKLPGTEIETDSYVAVQLIEQKKALDFSSLKYMAEQVEGSFTFTVLDSEDSIYIVKGGSPICLYQYPGLGLFLYASTEEILQDALKRVTLPRARKKRIDISCGQIVKIDRSGTVLKSSFHSGSIVRGFCGYPYHLCVPPKPYLEELKELASMFGYSPREIERFHRNGYSAQEIEELLYSGEI